MKQIQPKAELLGSKLSVQDRNRIGFSQDLIGQSLLVSLGQVLEKTESLLRQQQALPGWLMLCPGRSQGARGYVVKSKNLSDVEYATFEKRTILIVDRLTGQEDIPANV